MQAETKTLKSFDGTELCLSSYGNSSARPLVLFNGVGANRAAWKHIVAHYRDRYHVVTWDYRGLYSSAEAPNRESYTMEHHARDIQTILESESCKEPIFLGWSMGVQVVLELQRLKPNLASAFIALQGAPGHSLNVAFESPSQRKVLSKVLNKGTYAGDGFAFLMAGLSKSKKVQDFLCGALRKIGTLSEDAEQEGMRSLIGDWMEHDLRVITSILKSLAEHNPAEQMGTVDMPTLVLGGGSDSFTPKVLTDAMADAIPNARLRYVPGATHFGMLEFPKLILKEMDEFLELESL